MDKKEALKKLVDTKKLDEARVYVEELLKIEPNNTDYLYYYAKILRQSKNNEDVLKAIELYKRLSQELNKDHNFLIGKLYLQIGNSEKAIKRLNRIKDHNLLAKYELAKLLKHEKQYEESIKLFEQLRNTKQDKISLYKILKHEEEIYKDLNKLEEFKEFLLNIINNQNKDAIYRILAEIFYNLEDYDTSEKYYLLVEHMNTHVKNNYLGEINYFKKEYEKALDYYFKCIETANDEEKDYFIIIEWLIAIII